jgi:hypothetical protein
MREVMEWPEVEEEVFGGTGGPNDGFGDDDFGVDVEDGKLVDVRLLGLGPGDDGGEEEVSGTGFRRADGGGFAGLYGLALLACLLRYWS